MSNFILGIIVNLISSIYIPAVFSTNFSGSFYHREEPYHTATEYLPIICVQRFYSTNFSGSFYHREEPYHTLAKYLTIICVTLVCVR